MAYSGKEESGPRALGCRSLLGSPLVTGQRDRMNKVKDREVYRPIALMILERERSKCFAGPSCPYMLRCATINSDWKEILIEGLHVDNTSRLQIVDDQSPPAVNNLLENFYQQTSIPALLNTSLNGRGEPLASTPTDAVNILKRCLIDRLFIENIEVWRAE